MSLFEWLSCSRATQTPWQISLRSCRRRDTRRRVTMDAPGEIPPPFKVCINRVEKDTTLLVIIPTHDVILHPIEKRESKERKKSLLQSAFVVVVHVVVPNRNARRVNIIFQGRTRRASLPRTTTTTKTKRRPRRKIRASVNARYVCVVRRFGF